MKIKFSPITKLGKWSVGFICAFFLILYVFFKIAKTAEIKGVTFFDTLSLAIPLMLVGISGVMAFILGAISIIKTNERSISVFLSCLIGLFVLIFALGEMFVSHK